MRKLIGGLLMASPLLAMLVGLAIYDGVVAALVLVGSIVGCIGVMSIGSYLLNS